MIQIHGRRRDILGEEQKQEKPRKEAVATVWYWESVGLFSCLSLDTTVGPFWSLNFMAFPMDQPEFVAQSSGQGLALGR